MAIKSECGSIWQTVTCKCIDWEGMEAWEIDATLFKICCPDKKILTYQQMSKDYENPQWELVKTHYVKDGKWEENGENKELS